MSGNEGMFEFSSRPSTPRDQKRPDILVRVEAVSSDLPCIHSANYHLCSETRLNDVRRALQKDFDPFFGGDGFSFLCKGKEIDFTREKELTLFDVLPKLTGIPKNPAFKYDQAVYKKLSCCVEGLDEEEGGKNKKGTTRRMVYCVGLLHVTQASPVSHWKPGQLLQSLSGDHASFPAFSPDLISSLSKMAVETRAGLICKMAVEGTEEELGQALEKSRQALAEWCRRTGKPPALVLRDPRRATPLHYAAEAARLGICEMIVLVLGREMLQERDINGRTPLQCALQRLGVRSRQHCLKSLEDKAALPAVESGKEKLVVKPSVEKEGKVTFDLTKSGPQSKSEENKQAGVILALPQPERHVGQKPAVEKTKKTPEGKEKTEETKSKPATESSSNGNKTGTSDVKDKPATMSKTESGQSKEKNGLARDKKAVKKEQTAERKDKAKPSQNNNGEAKSKQQGDASQTMTPLEKEANAISVNIANVLRIKNARDEQARKKLESKNIKSKKKPSSSTKAVVDSNRKSTAADRDKSKEDSDSGSNTSEKPAEDQEKGKSRTKPTESAKSDTGQTKAKGSMKAKDKGVDANERKEEVDKERKDKDIGITSSEREQEAAKEGKEKQVKFNTGDQKTDAAKEAKDKDAKVIKSEGKKETAKGEKEEDAKDVTNERKEVEKKEKDEGVKVIASEAKKATALEGKKKEANTLKKEIPNKGKDEVVKTITSTGKKEVTKKRVNLVKWKAVAKVTSLEPPRGPRPRGVQLSEWRQDQLDTVLYLLLLNADLETPDCHGVAALDALTTLSSADTGYLMSAIDPELSDLSIDLVFHFAMVAMEMAWDRPHVQDQGRDVFTRKEWRQLAVRYCVCLPTYPREEVMPPLHMAALIGLKDAIEPLLLQGHSPLQRNCNGYLAFHYACQNGHSKLISLLCTEDLTADDVALGYQLAGRRDHVSTLRKIFDKTDEKFNSAYREDVVRLSEKDLDGAGLQLIPMLREDRRSLERLQALAARQAKVEALTLILTLNVNPNARDFMGRTPLHEAAQGPRDQPEAHSPAKEEPSKSTTKSTKSGSQDSKLSESKKSFKVPTDGRREKKKHLGEGKESKKKDETTTVGDSQQSPKQLSAGEPSAGKESEKEDKKAPDQEGREAKGMGDNSDSKDNKSEDSSSLDKPQNSSQSATPKDSKAPESHEKQTKSHTSATKKKQEALEGPEAGEEKSCDHARCIRLLLKAGADPRICDWRGSTPLHYAAAAGQLECVEALLTSDLCPLASRDACGRTPLLVAAHWRRRRVVSFLVRTNVSALNLTAADVLGASILAYLPQLPPKTVDAIFESLATDDTAASKEGEDTGQMKDPLTEHDNLMRWIEPNLYGLGKYFAAKDKRRALQEKPKLTPKMDGSPGKWKYQDEAESSPDQKESRSNAASVEDVDIGAVIKSGNARVLEKILAILPHKVNDSNAAGLTELAVRLGNIDILKTLVEHRTFTVTEATTLLFKTLMHCEHRKNDRTKSAVILKYLLDKGARADEPRDTGRRIWENDEIHESFTALEMAVLMDWEEVVDMFLERGTSVLTGFAVHLAALRGNVSIFGKLLVRHKQARKLINLDISEAVRVCSRENGILVAACCSRKLSLELVEKIKELKDFGSQIFSSKKLLTKRMIERVRPGMSEILRRHGYAHQNEACGALDALLLSLETKKREIVEEVALFLLDNKVHTGEVRITKKKNVHALCRAFEKALRAKQWKVAQGLLHSDGRRLWKCILSKHSLCCETSSLKSLGSLIAMSPIHFLQHFLSLGRETMQKMTKVELRDLEKSYPWSEWPENLPENPFGVFLQILIVYHLPVYRRHVKNSILYVKLLLLFPEEMNQEKDPFFDTLSPKPGPPLRAAKRPNPSAARKSNQKPASSSSDTEVQCFIEKYMREPLFYDVCHLIQRIPDLLVRQRARSKTSGSSFNRSKLTLYLACFLGDEDLVKLSLHKVNLKLTAEEENFLTPAEVAAARGHLDLVDLLLKRGDVLRLSFLTSDRLLVDPDWEPVSWRNKWCGSYWKKWAGHLLKGVDKDTQRLYRMDEDARLKILERFWPNMRQDTGGCVDVTFLAKLRQWRLLEKLRDKNLQASGLSRPPHKCLPDGKGTEEQTSNSATTKEHSKTSSKTEQNQKTKSSDEDNKKVKTGAENDGTNSTEADTGEDGEACDDFLEAEVDLLLHGPRTLALWFLSSPHLQNRPRCWNIRALFLSCHRKDGEVTKSLLERVDWNDGSLLPADCQQAEQHLINVNWASTHAERNVNTVLQHILCNPKIRAPPGLLLQCLKRQQWSLSKTLSFGTVRIVDSFFLPLRPRKGRESSSETAKVLKRGTPLEARITYLKKLWGQSNTATIDLLSHAAEVRDFALLRKVLAAPWMKHRLYDNFADKEKLNSLIARVVNPHAYWNIVVGDDKAVWGRDDSADVVQVLDMLVRRGGVIGLQCLTFPFPKIKKMFEQPITLPAQDEVRKCAVVQRFWEHIQTHEREGALDLRDVARARQWRLLDALQGKAVPPSPVNSLLDAQSYLRAVITDAPQQVVINFLKWMSTYKSLTTDTYIVQLMWSHCCLRDDPAINNVLVKHILEPHVDKLQRWNLFVSDIRSLGRLVLEPPANAFVANDNASGLVRWFRSMADICPEDTIDCKDLDEVLAQSLASKSWAVAEALLLAGARLRHSVPSLHCKRARPPATAQTLKEATKRQSKKIFPHLYNRSDSAADALSPDSNTFKKMTRVKKAPSKPKKEKPGEASNSHEVPESSKGQNGGSQTEQAKEEEKPVTKVPHSEEEMRTRRLLRLLEVAPATAETEPTSMKIRQHKDLLSASAAEGDIELMRKLLSHPLRCFWKPGDLSPVISAVLNVQPQAVSVLLEHGFTAPDSEKLQLACLAALLKVSTKPGAMEEIATSLSCFAEDENRLKKGLQLRFCGSGDILDDIKNEADIVTRARRMRVHRQDHFTETSPEKLKEIVSRAMEGNTASPTVRKMIIVTLLSQMPGLLAEMLNEENLKSAVKQLGSSLTEAIIAFDTSWKRKSSEALQEEKMRCINKMSFIIDVSPAPKFVELARRKGMYPVLEAVARSLAHQDVLSQGEWIHVLEDAVRQGNSSLVRTFTRSALQPNPSPEVCRLLHVAAKHRHAELVDLLLDWGLPADSKQDMMAYKPPNKIMPVECAVHAGDAGIMERLLDVIQDPENDLLGRLVETAITKGSVDCLNRLRERSPSVTVSKISVDLFVKAASLGLEDMCLTILALDGIDAKVFLNNEKLLQHACRRNMEKLVKKILTENPSLVNASTAIAFGSDVYNLRPLDLARIMGHVGLGLDLLNNHNAEPSDTIRDVLHDKSALECPGWLSKHLRDNEKAGGDDTSSSTSHRPRSRRLQCGLIEFLKAGNDIAANSRVESWPDYVISAMKSSLSAAPLFHLAARHGCVETLKTLASAAKRFAPESVSEWMNEDISETIPLALAIESGNAVSVKVIHGLDSSHAWKSRHGENILHIAARQGDMEIVKTVGEFAFASLKSAKDRNGVTPAGIAVAFGNQDCLPLLLDSDLDTNEHEQHQETNYACTACLLLRCIGWSRFYQSARDPPPRSYMNVMKRTKSTNGFHKEIALRKGRDGLVHVVALLHDWFLQSKDERLIKSALSRMGYECQVENTILFLLLSTTGDLTKTVSICIHKGWNRAAIKAMAGMMMAMQANEAFNFAEQAVVFDRMEVLEHLLQNNQSNLGEESKLDAPSLMETALAFDRRAIAQKLRATFGSRRCVSGPFEYSQQIQDGLPWKFKWLTGIAQPCQDPWSINDDASRRFSVTDAALALSLDDKRVQSAFEKTAVKENVLPQSVLGKSLVLDLGDIGKHLQGRSVSDVILKALVASTVLGRYPHVLCVDAPAFEKVKRVRVTCLSPSDPAPASLKLQRDGTELVDNIKVKVDPRPGRGVGVDFHTCQEPPDELSEVAALKAKVNGEIIQAAQAEFKKSLDLDVKVSVQWDSVESLGKDARRFVVESLAGVRGAGPLAGLVEVIQQCGLLLEAIQALLSPENAKALTRSTKTLTEITVKVTTQLPKRTSGFPRVESTAAWPCCLSNDGEDFSLRINAHLLSLYSFLWTCQNACILVSSEHPYRFMKESSTSFLPTPTTEVGDNFLPSVFLGKKIHVDFDSFRELCAGGKISDMALRRVIMTTVLNRYPVVLDLNSEAWESVALVKVVCMPHSAHEEACITMATGSTCLKDTVKLRMLEQATQPEVTCDRDAPDFLTSVWDVRRGVDALAAELTEKTTAFLGKETTVRVDWASVDDIQDTRLRRQAMHTLLGDGGLPPLGGLSDVLERCRALRDNIEDYQSKDFADGVLQLLRPVKEVVVRFSDKLPEVRPKFLSAVDSSDTWFISPDRRSPFSFVYCSRHLFLFSALRGCQALTLSLQEASSVLKPSRFHISWSSFGAVCKVDDFGKLGREGLAAKAARMAGDVCRLVTTPYDDIKWSLENSAGKPSVQAEYTSGNGAIWKVSVLVNARLNNGTWIVGFPDCLTSLAEAKLAARKEEEEEETSSIRKSLQKVAGSLSKTIGKKLEISLKTDHGRKIQRYLASVHSYDSDLDWFSEYELQAVEERHHEDEKISAQLPEVVVLEGVLQALKNCNCKLIGEVGKKHAKSRSEEVAPGLWYSLTQESLHNGLSCERILMLLKEDQEKMESNHRGRYKPKTRHGVLEVLDDKRFMETTKKGAQSKSPSEVIGAWYYKPMSKAREERERFGKDPRSFPQLVTICNKIFFVENPKQTLRVLSRIPEKIVVCEDSNAQNGKGTFHFVRNDPRPVDSLSAYLLAGTSTLPKADLSVFQAWETGVNLGVSLVFDSDSKSTTLGQQRAMAEAVDTTLTNYLKRTYDRTSRELALLFNLKDTRVFLENLGSFYVGKGQPSTLPFMPLDTVTGDSFGEPVDIYMSSKQDIYVSFREADLLKLEEPSSAADARNIDTKTRFTQEHLIGDGAKVTFLESFSKAMAIHLCRREEKELSAKLSQGGLSIQVDIKLAHLVPNKNPENFVQESAIASRTLVTALHSMQVLDVKSVEFTAGKATAKTKSSPCIKFQNGALKLPLTDGGKRWTPEGLGNALKQFTRSSSEAAVDEPTPIARVRFPFVKLFKMTGVDSGHKPNQIVVVEKTGKFPICVAHERECRVASSLVNPCLPNELQMESAPTREDRDCRRLLTAYTLHVQFYAHVRGGFYDMTDINIYEVDQSESVDVPLHLTGLTVYSCRVSRLHKKAGLSARCLICGHPLALVTPHASVPGGTALELVRRRKERKS